MQNEPKTFADLDLMLKTSEGWFDGCVKYESTDNPIEEGQINSIRYHVSVSYSNTYVEVYKATHVISNVRSNSSFSCTVNQETVEKYNSMEEFKSSKWYELTMSKFGNGDVDASWLNSACVDEKEVPTRDVFAVTDINMEVGNQYKDWLGNVRQGKGHSTLSIRIDRMSGCLCLYCGDYRVEDFTVKELQEAVDLVNNLKSCNVKVKGGMLTVPIAGLE